jgi:small-conductance mechanosensitive channel
MRTFLVLLLKAFLFIVLLMVRMGEWDLKWLYRGVRFETDISNFISVFSGVALLMILLDYLQFSVIWWYRRVHKIRGDDNFIIGINHIYTLVLVAGVIVGFFSLFQVDFKALFTSLSIIFAGLAILTKDYISNLINGMILTFSGQLSIGDNVQIGKHRGKITAITLQSVHLLNDDDDMIYIPNNLVSNGEVVNYTKREIKRTSIEFEIALQHLKTVEDLEQQLVEALRPFHDLINPETYYLRVAEVNIDSISFKFQYILKNPDKELERRIRRTAIRRLVEIISGREKIVDQIPDLPDDLGHHVI